MAHILRESYGSLVDAKLRATLVTKDNFIFNTNYEGLPTAGAVKVPVRDGEVTVNDYSTTNLSSNAATYGSTKYITAVLDADKFVNEYIDGFEADAVPDNLVADRLDSAGYSLANIMDTDAVNALCYAIAGKDHAGTAYAATDPRYQKVGTQVEMSGSKTIFDAIVDAMVAQDNAHVPAEGRYLIVTPAAYAELIKSDDFIKKGDLSQELVMSGAVGMIAGYAIYKSAKLAAAGTTASLTNLKAIAGHPLFATRVEAWRVEPKLVDGNSDANVVGGSFVKGRKIYVHEITKPQAFVYIN